MNTPLLSEKSIIVLHIHTTGDEHQICVSRNVAEVIELAWIVVDGRTLQELERSSILVRPVRTPVTDLCTNATTLTLADLEQAVSLKEAVFAFDYSIRRWSTDGSDLSFIVLDALDLRVQLDREAREKSVILPFFMQFPRYYEVSKEFRKWQMLRTDGMSGSLSTYTMATAMNLDLPPPTRHMTPMMTSFATSPPRRALDECTNLLLLSQTLLSLNPTLFRTPLDARLDIDAFIQEQSKIIHMSGLPLDTTQSELESWFTNHSSRPIAFWTLRTPDASKSIGSGYALFSTHREASDALNINGRALQSNTIRISPSSSRVLDRASELLISFPASKNRPRPGDWSCPSCGFSNFQRRTTCFRCSYPPYGTPQGIPFRAGDWNCSNCRFHNFARNSRCLKCACERGMM